MSILNLQTTKINPCLPSIPTNTSQSQKINTTADLSQQTSLSVLLDQYLPKYNRR